MLLAGKYIFCANYLYSAVYVFCLFHADTKLELTNDLSKIYSLTKSLASDWRHLGSLLGLTNDTLELIGSTPAVPDVYLNRVLMKWMCGDAEPPTVAVLVKALNRMSGTEDIVQQIIDGISSLLVVHYCV